MSASEDSAFEFSARPELFGRTAAGEDVHRVTLEGGGLTARIMTWGATLQELRLEGHAPPLTLGFPDFDSYPRYSALFRADAGPLRQPHRQGPLHPRRHELPARAQRGRKSSAWRPCRHGKERLAHRRPLAPTASGSFGVDPDGAAGYPGNCTISCTYTLKDGGVLSIDYEAETDRPTICNLAHHSYFNLDGGPTILDHNLIIAADAYLPTREDQIPTGEIAPVANTPFDFGELRPVRREENGRQVLYDHNFCLSRGRTGKRSVALLGSERSGIGMEVRTTEPGIQFYCGFKLKPTVPGLEGRLHQPFAGLCLETQVWPDAPNHPDFPSAVLRPGETLRQQTDYVFVRE